MNVNVSSLQLFRRLCSHTHRQIRTLNGCFLTLIEVVKFDAYLAGHLLYSNKDLRYLLRASNDRVWEYFEFL